MSDRNKDYLQLAGFVCLILWKAFGFAQGGASKFAVPMVVCAFGFLAIGVETLRKRTRKSRRFIVILRAGSLFFSAEMAYHFFGSWIGFIWMALTVYFAVTFANALGKEEREAWRNVLSPTYIVLMALAAACIAIVMWLAVAGG